MGLQASSALTLRELSSILRPVAADSQLPVAGWKVLIKEIESTIESRPIGMLLLSGTNGVGKSTFAKLLQNSLAHRPRCHLVTGTVAEHIGTPGWLWGFLGDTVAGPMDQRMNIRALIERLFDLKGELGSLVLVLDGLDLIEPQALAADLAGFLGVISEAGMSVLLIGLIDGASADLLKQAPLLMNRSVLMRDLPAPQPDELKAILMSRFEAAGLDPLDYDTELNEAIASSGCIPGRALRLLVDRLSSRTSVVTPPVPVARKVEAVAVPLEKEQKIKSHKAPESPKVVKKQDNKGKSTSGEPEKKRVSYDDLLSVRKAGS